MRGRVLGYLLLAMIAGGIYALAIAWLRMYFPGIPAYLAPVAFSVIGLINFFVVLVINYTREEPDEL